MRRSCVLSLVCLCLSVHSLSYYSTYQPQACCDPFVEICWRISYGCNDSPFFGASFILSLREESYFAAEICFIDQRNLGRRKKNSSGGSSWKESKLKIIMTSLVTTLQWSRCGPDVKLPGLLRLFRHYHDPKRFVFWLDIDLVSTLVENPNLSYRASKTTQRGKLTREEEEGWRHKFKWRSDIKCESDSFLLWMTLEVLSSLLPRRPLPPVDLWLHKIPISLLHGS